MGAADDGRERFWRERLAAALRQDLAMELEMADALARDILDMGVPPGVREGSLRLALEQSPGATPDWVERVMRIVQEVRDGLRRAHQEPPAREDQAKPPLPLQPRAPEPPEEPPAAPQRLEPPTTMTQLPPAGKPLHDQAHTCPMVDHESILALVMERLRAVHQFRQVEPKVLGAQSNLRTLRIAVAGEADDSVRLPHLLAEWLDLRRDWAEQNQILHAAQSTLRATEWLLTFLQWPASKER